MNIQKTNINFGQKYPTSKILEITTKKIFDSDGMQGYIQALKQIHGNIPRYVGHQGYKRYAEEVSERIFDKYPEIKQASKDILEIADKNPNIFSKDLKFLVKPVLDRFEKEIDIII